MSYTIVQPEARAARGEVLDLWKRNLPDASDRRYDWLYENGPASGWVIRSEDEKAVGAIGMMRRTMKVLDKHCQVGQPIDLNIDKRHRMGGPAIQLQRRLTEAVDSGELALAYGLPNAQAEPVLRRAGYHELDRMGRWVKPLRTDNLLGKWVKNGFLRRAAAAALDTALWLASSETYRHGRLGVHAEIVDVFDERFDRLWETARDRCPIIGQRGSDYLRWRFSDCPNARYRTLCLSDEEDRLLAYLTYCQPQDAAYVGDLFFAEERDLYLLLAEFLWMLRRQRVETATLAFLGSAVVEKALRVFGFHRRPSQCMFMVYANDEELAAAAGSTDRDAAFQRALRKENWFLTCADLDTEC